MFDPERILGSLIQNGLGGSRGLGGLGGGKVAIGLGLLGVAMEAFEHYTAQKQSQTQSAPSQSPPAGPAQMPSQPPPLASPAGPPPPPPIPGQGSAPPPPASGQSYEEAMLLIHAMIAAAYADGQIDVDEQNRIMEKLSGPDFSDEDRQFILKALRTPMPIDAVLASVNTPVLAQKVYAVSLAAINVDTNAERTYLRDLAKRLYLSDAVISKIHSDLGCPLVQEKE